VPDEGSDELKHVAHCRMALKCCVLQYTLCFNKIMVVFVGGGGNSSSSNSCSSVADALVKLDFWGSFLVAVGTVTTPFVVFLPRHFISLSVP
jgi:hypothetical protein